MHIMKTLCFGCILKKHSRPQLMITLSFISALSQVGHWPLLAFCLNLLGLPGGWRLPQNIWQWHECHRITQSQKKYPTDVLLYYWQLTSHHLNWAYSANYAWACLQLLLDQSRLSAHLVQKRQRLLFISHFPSVPLPWFAKLCIIQSGSCKFLEIKGININVLSP